MEPIFPLHEEHINRFCGMPVCIVTKEGHRHVGILTSCKDGRLALNEGHGFDEEELTTSSTKVAKSSGKRGKNKKSSAVMETTKVDTKHFAPYPPQQFQPYPYNPWRRPFFIDLALIAFLFLLF